MSVAGYEGKSNYLCNNNLQTNRMAAYIELSKSALLEKINTYDENGVFSPYYSQYGVTESLVDFIKDEHISIFGIFVANEKFCVVYGKTLRPDEIPQECDKGTVFSKLKVYGSSKEYKGVVDGTGRSVIPTQYTEIRPLMNDILCVRTKSGKYGLRRLSGEIVADAEYDGFGPVSESLFSAYYNGKLGFLNLKGEMEIPFEYEKDNEDVLFSGGLACVLKKVSPEKSLYGYINHKNEVIIPFRFSFHEDFNKNDSIRNFEYVTTFPGDYRKDEYLLSLDGSMTLLDSNYVEGHNSDL